MNININLNGPLSADHAAKAARAQEIRQRAENVLSALNHPDDSFQVDSHERLGMCDFKGKIGPEQFASANASLKNGEIDAFAAHNPAAKPGETVKFHLSSAKAQGFRAAVASGFGAVGGGLANVGAFLLAKAITTYPEHKVTGKALELVSYPFSGASNLARFAEHKLAYTSEKDRYYAVAGADGSYEQVTFHNDNTLDYEFFAKV